MRLKSIKAKISLISACTIIAGIAAVLIVMYVSLQNLADGQAEEQLTTVGIHVRELMRNTVDQPADFVRVTTAEASLFAHERSLSREAYAEFMRKTVGGCESLNGSAFMFEHNAFDGQDGRYVGTGYGAPVEGRVSFYILRGSGGAEYTNGVEADGSEFEQDYYIVPFTQNKMILTEPYMYEISGQSHNTITISAPIRDENGKPIGVTTADIFLDDLLEKLKDEEIFTTGYAVLTNGSGTVIYSPNDSDLGQNKNTVGLAYAQSPDGPVTDSVKSAVTGGASLAVTMPVRFNALPDTYYVSVVAPLSEINAKNDSLTMLVVALFLVVAALLIIMIYFAVSRALKPVGSLVDASRLMAEGDLDFRLPKRSGDEIGVLSDNFMRLRDTFRRLISELGALAARHQDDGETDMRLDAGAYSGAYADVTRAINGMLDGHVESKKEALACISGIVNGHFDTPIRAFPGHEGYVNESIEGLRENIREIVREISLCAEQATAGNLTFKLDLSGYKGDWRELMEGLNGLMKAVADPIAETMWILTEISQGNFDKRVETVYQGEFDSIKQTANATAETIHSYIDEIARTLRAMAGGDLTNEIARAYVGQFTDIKDSINTISKSLNTTMVEITSASGQVLTMARQISQSAMTLAQGATEQASSLEELNAMVYEIDGQTNDNAQNAQQASKLAEASKANAETGNSEMQELLRAMEGIGQSSAKISNIIKTIEDIASQTNLLALNAAVEAARAGEHGKGFTVVAGEVRSLAEKSRQAAQETSSLIQESIRRVSEGTKCANDTAGSLEKIVGNVVDVSEVIGKISDASTRQQEAIDHVSTGLNQISHVVRSNSATSEESADTSQELTSQAETLRRMIEFFKTE